MQLERVLIGVLILLVLVLLPVRRDSGGRFAFLGFLIGVFATIGLVGLALDLGDFVPDSFADGVVKAQIGVMQRDQQSHVPRNLVILEGSSQTALGIDGAAVEAQLREAGYDATVVQFSGVGGNHLERYVALKQFAAEAKRQGLVLSPNTRLLLEIAPGYDEDPTRFLMNNKDSMRVYRYSTFGNLLFAVHSWNMTGHPYDAETLRTLGALFEDTLISTFRIGFLPYMRRFDEVEGSPSYVPAPDPAGPFRHYDPQEFARAPAAPLDPKWVAFDAYRAQRIEALFGGGITEVDYFSVPTMRNVKMLDYVHGFCAQVEPTPCIDASDPAIYGAVDAPQYYYGRDHLSLAGSKIYSKYLADQLIARNVVVK